MRRKVQPLLIVLLALVFAGCALNGTARHKAVVVDTGLYTAIAAVDDVEMALSRSGQVDAIQHQQLNPLILNLLKVGQSANRAIQVWPQGQPAPKELAAVVVQLGAVAHAVIDVLPDGPAKAKLASAVMLAQNAAALLLALLPGGDDPINPCAGWLDQVHQYRDVDGYRAERITRLCAGRAS